MFQPREPQTGGVGDTPLNAQYTPDRITSLGPNDIFVFGSNLQGRHAGGAARVAMNRIVLPVFRQGFKLKQNKERSDGGRLLLFAPTLTSQGFCFCPPQS